MKKFFCEFLREAVPPCAPRARTNASELLSNWPSAPQRRRGHRHGEGKVCDYRSPFMFRLVSHPQEVTQFLGDACKIRVGFLDAFGDGDEIGGGDEVALDQPTQHLELP